MMLADVAYISSSNQCTLGSAVTDMTICACFRDPLGWHMVMYGGFLLAKWIPLF